LINRADYQIGGGVALRLRTQACDWAGAEAQERGIVGETPNLAARLQGVAEPNTIVVAESTRKQWFEGADLVESS
jgi:class 3 adenylate cyclase